jgi:hypothetical protein
MPSPYVALASNVALSPIAVPSMSTTPPAT